MTAKTIGEKFVLNDFGTQWVLGGFFFRVDRLAEKNMQLAPWSNPLDGWFLRPYLKDWFPVSFSG